MSHPTANTPPHSRRSHHFLVQFAGPAQQLWRDARVLSLEMVRLLGRHRWKVLSGFAIVVAACVWLISPHDLAWLRSIQQACAGGRTNPVCETARALSYWGDFLGFNVTTMVILYALCLLLRSRYLRLVVVASVLGTCFTGGTANLGRATLGRARPSAPDAPGFFGPTLRARHHSCPSGHTATAFGGSIPVAMALPQVGVPLMIAASGIAWSRLHNNAHHPTDILLSITLATVFGVPLGLLARRLGRDRAFRQGCYSALGARRRARAGAAPAPAPNSSAPHSGR